MAAGPPAGRGDSLYPSGTPNPCSDGDARRVCETLRQLRDALSDADRRFGDPGVGPAVRIAEKLLQRLGAECPPPPENPGPVLGPAARRRLGDEG